MRLNCLLAEAGLEPLGPVLAGRFEEQFSLILRWNAHVNLTAIRDVEGILVRHFVESIACARALPAGIATLLDVGSGAGFPGIPESQGKKAAFLSEVVRVLGVAAKVHSGRAETLRAVFDCVTLRAVDKMPQAVKAAGKLVAPGGWLALMTTGKELDALKAAAGTEFAWAEPLPLPGSKDRLLALAAREINSPA
jgi:16S rRNA (guanine527-N7)-methyltransferase